MSSIYLAHKNENGDVQTVREHSEGTAARSRDSAVESLKALCYVIGLTHDAGKYQKAFQERINGKNVHIEHSICGAKLCREAFGNTPIGLLAELCIAGHHTGIPDCGTLGDTKDMKTLYGRLKRETEDFSRFRQEIEVPPLDADAFNRYLMADCTAKEDVVEKFAFLVRYCFSCLTDADSIDTAIAVGGEAERALTADFAACLADVDRKLASFACETDLQKARHALQEQVFGKADDDSAIYLMNMPTGSGKTLCSIKFALERAVRKNKKRIIYVIPYNSIIEQTADDFEKMFGSHAQILRHQSTFSYEDQEDLDEDYRRTAKYACENWDAQIVITTAVQFFESLYANKRGRLRKMHNMADSVLLFDEAHLMPIEYLQPCLRSIDYITRYLGSEAVFLTATMPDFKSLLNLYAMKDPTILDLVADQKEFEKFAKCKYSRLGAIEDETLAEKAAASPSSLIVVNSRKGAKEIFKLCKGKKYHLSTYMTAFDRSAVIREIKGELEKLEKDFPGLEGVPPERRIVVVSTSLIEAGVDLDFYTVFRELAGLDSILQAGGRCNREGKRPSADVFVFERTADAGKKAADERRDITRGIIESFADISSQEAVRAYYDRLFFTRRGEITKNSISKDCSDLRRIEFASYNVKFIDTQTVSVAVARDESSGKAIEKIRETGRGKAREIQKYCFSVRPKEFNELLAQHAVDDFGSGIYCLTNMDYYDTQTGVVFEGKDIIV